MFASSEVAGFVKTGGLADVSAALPRALAARGHDCVVVMPLYRTIRQGNRPTRPTKHILNIPIRNHLINGSVWESSLPNSKVPVYLISQADYFERDNPAEGRTIYQYTDENGKKLDYPDNCARFTFFNRATLELIRMLDFWPDVLHLNDWHTGLVPVYLKEIYANHQTRVFRPRYRRIKTLFTIHNIAYQGLFGHWDYPITGLPWSLFNYRELEFYGRFNFLKAGLAFSDWVTAVSPTYAKEIQTPAFGSGLNGVLFERRNRLSGIVNGVDYSIWSPERDPFIAFKYDENCVTEGKPICKKTLQQTMELPVEANTPVLGMVSRLVAQKGLDLLEECAEDLLQNNLQLVVLGDGEQSYRDMLTAFKKRYPSKVGIHLGYNEELAHQIEAGADMYLMPSMFEPCGLNQLYSLKYGTVPIVRKTGGLADTVTDTTPETLSAGTATGFVFELPTPLALMGAIQRALICYQTQPAKWLSIIRNGMKQNWSWNKSAGEYEKLYEKLLRSPP